MFGTSHGKSKSKNAKVVAKYRDPETGATWSGRGRQPRWLQGKKAEDYLIESA